MPSATQDKVTLKELQDFYLNDLEALAEDILIPFEFGENFPLCEFHRERLRDTGDCIVNNVPKTLDLWFRGGFKTTFVSRYGILLRILRNPNLTVLIRHGEAEKAEGIVKNIKFHLTNNKKLRALFPAHCPPAGQRFGTQSFFDLPNRTNTAPEHTVTGVGIEANLTGGHWMHIHSDDIEHEGNVGTGDTRLKLIRKWQDTHSLLVKPPVYDGTQSEVGTVWHSKALWTHLLERFGPESDCPAEAKYVVHFHPVVHGKVKNGRFLPDTDEKGEWIPTAPEILDIPEIKTLAYKEGPYRFSSNYFLCPQDEDSAVFRDEWIQYKSYPSVLKPYDKAWLGTGVIVRRVLTIDLASSQERDADMVGYLIVDIDDVGQWYVREAFRRRIDALALIHKIQALHEEWDFESIYIDSVASQIYFSKWLRRENQIEGISMPVIPVKKVDSKKSKEMRIMACQPRWARKDCYIVEGAKGTKTLVNDMMQYPALQYDDLIDSMAQLEMQEVKGRSPKKAEMPEGCAQWWMDVMDSQSSVPRGTKRVGNWRSQPKKANYIKAIRRKYA